MRQPRSMQLECRRRKGEEGARRDEETQGRKLFVGGFVRGIGGDPSMEEVLDLMEVEEDEVEVEDAQYGKWFGKSEFRFTFVVMRERERAVQCLDVEHNKPIT